MSQGPEAGKLFIAEEKLNQFVYDKMPVGGLLSFTFNYLHKGAYQSSVSTKRQLLLKIFVRSLSLPKFKAGKAKVFYYRSGNSHHHNRLQEVITENFSETDYMVYAAGGKNQLGIVPGAASFLGVLKFCYSNKSKVLSILREAGIAEQVLPGVFLDLIIQLNRASTWKKYFSLSNNIKLVAGDYDRGNESSAVFIAAKACGIKTVVIQHGVVNPPYGFFPLIADKVCVWGEIQELQFKKMNTAQTRILVTGTPIIDHKQKNAASKEEISEKYSMDSNKKNIVLCVNPIQPHHNQILIDAFLETMQSLDQNRYTFYLKLHPAQKPEQFPGLKDFPSLKIWDKKISNDEFFKICDVLITHNSGIANEALFFGIPVGILDILPISAGNGLELNEYMNVPLLQSAQQMTDFIEQVSAKDFNLQQNIDISRFYYKTGKEALKNIGTELQKQLV